MITLLQTLLSQFLSSEPDPVLLSYIEIVLPGLERSLGEYRELPRVKISWVDGSSEQQLAEQVLGSNKSFQSLPIYVLNGLLIIWSLLPLICRRLTPSTDEKRLLCLSFTLYGYRLYSPKSFSSERPILSLEASKAILEEQFDSDSFWSTWQDYLPEILQLAQMLFRDREKGTPSDNQFPNCLKPSLAQLCLFGAIATQLSSPADIVTTPEGERLNALLKELEIDRTLIYHQLRSSTGFLTNSIHNSVIHFTQTLNWQPILLFAEGAIYLVPPGRKLPARLDLQSIAWQHVRSELTTKMLTGAIGCKRAGKGLKVAPQTLELLSPAQLIQNLPQLTVAIIKNEADPATPKRLERLNLTPREREFLAHGADLRSDRIAEFIIFLQKQFFAANPKFIPWILDQLSIQSAITPEQTQIFSGGVNWGWYRAAAYYIASYPDLDLESVTTKLQPESPIN